ncbi:hypothetical protein JCM8097_001574 [Rhodosporidiobolus ruineniae]
MSSPPAAKKSILQKGNACSTCKARKVRCDAVKPRCGSCTRSARFRGINPDSITCDYLPPPLKRSSSTTPSKRAAAKRRRAATDDLAATAVLVDTVERELVQPSLDSPSSPSFAGIFSRTPFSFEPVDPFFVYVDSPTRLAVPAAQQ